MVAAAGGNPGQGVHTFSKQELAQAVAFVHEVQRAERGLIVEPVAMLQVRYGINDSRARALATQLELLGFWAVFVVDNGTCYAQVLRG